MKALPLVLCPSRIVRRKLRRSLQNGWAVRSSEKQWEAVVPGRHSQWHLCGSNSGPRCSGRTQSQSPTYDRGDFAYHLLRLLLSTSLGSFKNRLRTRLKLPSRYGGECKWKSMQMTHRRSLISGFFCVIIDQRLHLEHITNFILTWMWGSLKMSVFTYKYNLSSLPA